MRQEVRRTWFASMFMAGSIVFKRLDVNKEPNKQVAEMYSHLSDYAVRQMEVFLSMADLDIAEEEAQKKGSAIK